MAVHRGLEAHTIMDSTGTHLLELVPLTHFIQQWNGTPWPAASPRCWDLRVLPSLPAARAQQSPGWQQHLLPQPWLCQSSALGHLCQGRSEQNVAPSRNAQLCRVTRFFTKTWAKPASAALQTGFIHSSHQICIYSQGRSLGTEHVAFVATARVWSNLFRQRNVVSGRHLLNVFTYWPSDKTPPIQFPPKISLNDKRWDVQDLNSQLQNTPRKNSPCDI